MRYGLRTMLIVVAVLCIWLGMRVNKVRRQQAAIAAIERLGGSIYYQYQLSRGYNGRFLAEPDAPPPYPRWCRRAAEQVFPPAVGRVNLRDTPTTDRDLELLRSLPDVTRLDLVNTNVTDEGMAVVGRLRKLQSLVLRGPSVGDRGVEHIKHLKLEYLSLWDTSVSDVGVHHLRDMTTLQVLILDGTKITDAALPDIGRLVNLNDWLGLTHTEVTDVGLPHLTTLKNLRKLNLIGTKVSREGLRDLRKALPQAHISPF